MNPAMRYGQRCYFPRGERDEAPAESNLVHTCLWKISHVTVATVLATSLSINWSNFALF